MFTRVQNYVKNSRSLIVIVSCICGVGISQSISDSQADPTQNSGCATLESMGPSYESIKKQIKDLDRVDVTTSEYKQNTQAQLVLWQQLSSLLMQYASQIGDTPRLATALQENGRALQEFAEVIELVSPYSADNPPSMELRARFSSASARKTITSRALSDAARDICARRM